MFKLRVFITNHLRKTWPKVALFALFAIATALAGVVLKRYFPGEVPFTVDQSTIGSILGIVASSMLTVTIFSLTTMVTAWGSATSNVTPRATQLLMQDSIAQNVLSTFIGSFVFALVGIITLGVGVYDDAGRLVLFVTTVLVILIILITLVSWIEHLHKLGRVQDTARLVEEEALKSLLCRARNPFMGAHPIKEGQSPVPEDAEVIRVKDCGYIQTIDMKTLSELAEKHDLELYIAALPGIFAGPDRALVHVKGALDDALCKKLREAFVIEQARSYDQDPRFGLCVLSEIGARALPPTIDDSGTVIDVIGRITRVLCLYAQEKDFDEDLKPLYPRLYVPALKAEDLFNDAFNPISRNAADLFEVQVRLQKSFTTLYKVGGEEFRQTAITYSSRALERVERSSMLEFEKSMLRQASLIFQD